MSQPPLVPGMHDLFRTSDAVTRSISAENPTGEKGAGGRATEGLAANLARELGQGWKIAPAITIGPGEAAVLADVAGPGIIQHIWMTVQPAQWRQLLLRFHWDDDEQAAVQVPLGDFFGQGWCEYAPLSSLPITVGPRGGLNSYWPMPFRSAARITLENLGDDDAVVFYQIDYALTSVPDDAAYLHAQWRRSDPVQAGEVHTILDGVRGQGHYVGTYLAWGVHHSGWWGEGELKFYLDGDREFPTICGTGTEDYIGGAFNFDVPGTGYSAFSTPYLGLHQVLRPDGLYRSQQRFGMYRWHVADPIRFSSDIRITVQALGIRRGKRFHPRSDDVASTAIWYGTSTSLASPLQPPSLDELEVI